MHTEFSRQLLGPKCSTSIMSFNSYNNSEVGVKVILHFIDEGNCETEG